MVANCAGAVSSNVDGVSASGLRIVGFDVVEFDVAGMFHSQLPLLALKLSAKLATFGGG